MDYGKAFVFMFEDPNWVRKIVIGTLMALLGIILLPILIGFIPLLILAGYILDLVRNVVNRQQYPLPEWEDWGGMLVRGIKLAVALFIWSLPAIVVAIPLTIGGTMLGNDSSGAQAVGGLLLTCGLCLVILWAIFVALITPGIYVRLAVRGRFSSAFEVGALWSFTRDHIGPVIVAILLTWVAGLIASLLSMVGLVLCCVGVLITIPLAMLWQYLVMSHLYGQIGAVAGYGQGGTGLVPVEIVPVQPAPVEPAPIQPTAVEPAPVEPGPAENEQTS
jgi:hypothetical protein